VEVFWFEMAKQIGDIKINGTIDGICFYTMDAQYYARQKSSLTGKRFWRDKKFEGSRRSCERLAEGSRIASKVYSQISGQRKNYSMFRVLKSKAMGMLKMGESSEDVFCKLQLLIWKTNRKNNLQVKNGRVVQSTRRLMIKPYQAIANAFAEYKDYYRNKNILLNEKPGFNYVNNLLELHEANAP
jgi:hypothetical protein